jgi:hypothetical protein
VQEGRINYDEFVAMMNKGNPEAHTKKGLWEDSTEMVISLSILCFYKFQMLMSEKPVCVKLGSCLVGKGMGEE